MWRNATDATDLAVASFYSYSGNGWPDRAKLQCLLTVTDIVKVYELGIKVSANATLSLNPTGAAISDGYAEVYQQIKFSKLS